LELEELFSESSIALMEDAIHRAESGTSGELRVHIDEFCKEDVLDHAAYLFGELDMQKTALRNGVLIYVSIEDRKLAILGDLGIHLKVSDDFWDCTRDIMVDHFREGKYVQGICEGVKRAGEQLQQFFPRETGDTNELPNTISIGNRRTSARP
jgi:uncharacterized membrane protein